MRGRTGPSAQGLSFREYLHQCKESGDHGTANERGDFTMDELRAKAREFLNIGDE